MKKCEICGIEFDEKRDSARFCTSRCRKLAFQKKVSVPPEGGLSVPKSGVSVPNPLSVPVSVPLKLIDPNDPKVIEEGMNISDEKKREMESTTLPSVTLDKPCRVSAGPNWGERYLDLERDLHLDLKKDLGIFAWTADGIFIRPDITIQQVRNIRRLVEAKHGWPHRQYDDESPLPYSTFKAVSAA